MEALESGVPVNFPDDEHTLYKIIEHERAQADHHKKRAHQLENMAQSLSKQNQIVIQALLELMNICEHYELDLNSDIVSRPTWNLLMEYKLRRDV